MKKTLKITEMFNDVFTDYEDREDTMYVTVDCECLGLEVCGICKLIERYE